MEEKLNAGETVWIVERDEEGNLCNVFGLMFLAEVAGFVIATSFVDDAEGLEETLAYHAEETDVYYSAELAVYPSTECWPTKEAAYTILTQKEGEDD